MMFRRSACGNKLFARFHRMCALVYLSTAFHSCGDWSSDHLPSVFSNAPSSVAVIDSCARSSLDCNAHESTDLSCESNPCRFDLTIPAARTVVETIVRRAQSDRAALHRRETTAAAADAAVAVASLDRDETATTRRTRQRQKTMMRKPKARLNPSLQLTPLSAVRLRACAAVRVPPVLDACVTTRSGQSPRSARVVAPPSAAPLSIPQAPARFAGSAKCA